MKDCFTHCVGFSGANYEMTVYNVSGRLVNQASKEGFAGIIFDCDGVLIDASKSYDQALEFSARAFAALLGFSFEGSDFGQVVESIRKLGSFNNDWDTLAVTVAYLYSRSSARKSLESLGMLSPPTRRLKEFESTVLTLFEKNSARKIDLLELVAIAKKSPVGSTRDDIIKRIIPDSNLFSRFRNSISYPAPVGKSLLGTFFDETMYGREVFKQTYGFDCSMLILPKDGFIANERALVSEETLSNLGNLCGGNLGIITGRPKVPTIRSLGSTFEKYFNKPEICLFTGDYLLSVDDVKPSPRPMTKVAGKLLGNAPIIYVGDSGEDILMVKRANTKELLNNRVFFVAIAQDREKADYFERQGDAVDCIVQSVNEIPEALLGEPSRAG